MDYLIVGGGSAGCVLANRLSESLDNHVVLVESGPDLTEKNVPADIITRYPGYAFLNPKYLWTNLKASFGASRSGPREMRAYEQARILGGGSSINAMAANRGAPSDYDGWEVLGARGWSWADVQPFFKKLETDLDFNNEHHGNDGPISIRRFDRPKWSGFATAIDECVRARGFPSSDDQNGIWADAIFPPSLSITADGSRASVALAYLSTSVRARPNLSVLTDTQALRIILKERRAIGVEVRDRQGERVLVADEIIVSCGAVFSPSLLMRSGIGPAAELQRLGIPLLMDKPGVGENLMEHPSLGMSCYLHPGARWTVPDEHHIHAGIRFSSELADAPQGDMHMSVLARSAWHAFGQRLGTLFFWVNKPYSRGRVRLRSPKADDAPDVDFALLSDQRDTLRLMNAFRFAAELLSAPALDKTRSVIFPTQFSERVRRISRRSLWNAFQSAAFGMLLDIAPAKETIIRTFISNGADVRQLVSDESALEAFVRRSVSGVWHPSGTCRMGHAGDPMAVSDENGRVRGVDGLRICDASLMPSIPCGNTNIPTIMMAEKISHEIACAQTLEN